MTRKAWGHPSEDVLLDLVEGTAGEKARQHLTGCSECQARVQSAQEGLLGSREVPVPEPPPLYWEALRRQIGRQVAGAEGVGHGLRIRWWPALAAAALLVSVLVLRPPTPVAVPAGLPLPSWSPLPPAEEDTGLDLLGALGPETADLGPAAECRDATDCVAGLSDEESQALADALRGELKGRVL